MTGKEKLELALAHQDGPLLIDIGGLPTTGIHCSVVKELREFYALARKPVTIQEPLQMSGLLDDDLKAVMEIETDPLWSARTVLGFDQTDEVKPWVTPWKEDVLVGKAFRTTQDTTGTDIYGGRDADAQPTGHMAVGETCFKLTDGSKPFGPVSDADAEWLSLQAMMSEEATDVVTGSLGGCRLGKLTATEEAGTDISKSLETVLDNLQKTYEAVGEAIQVLFVRAADLGNQNGHYYQAVNEWVHTHTKWHTFFHCGGNLENELPRIVKAGFDIVNPTLRNGQSLDRKKLKKEYGRNIVFWGGGIDTKKTLTLGTPLKVYDETLKNCEILGKDGGFVFSTGDSIPSGVSAENVTTMLRAVEHYNAGH